MVQFSSVLLVGVGCLCGQFFAFLLAWRIREPKITVYQVENDDTATFCSALSATGIVYNSADMSTNEICFSHHHKLPRELYSIRFLFSLG
jgi:hypothetical protein